MKLKKEFEEDIIELLDALLNIVAKRNLKEDKYIYQYALSNLLNMTFTAQIMEKSDYIKTMETEFKLCLENEEVQ